MTRRQILHMVGSLVVVVLFVLNALKVLPLPFLDRLEPLSYDLRVRLAAPNIMDPRIVLIDLDDRSLAEVGRWPWGRDRVAELVEILFSDYQIGVLGFDLLFAEPDDGSGLAVLESLAKGPLRQDQFFLSHFNKIRPSLLRDDKLAERLSNRPIILGYAFKAKPTLRVGGLPDPVLTLKAFGQSNIPFPKPEGFTANLPQFQRSALSGGFFDNPLVDDDGVFRRIPLLQQFEGGLYQSLPLAVVRAILGNPPLTMGMQTTATAPTDIEHGLVWLGLGPHQIPVDEQGAVWIPFRGNHPSFPYISAIDVLRRTANEKQLADAIVLVGNTAGGSMPMRQTPLQSHFPDIEIHANIISGMLDGTIQHQPSFPRGHALFTLLVIGTAFTLLVPLLNLFQKPTWVVYLTVLVLLILLWSHFLFWRKWHLVLPLASPVVMTFLLFLFHTAYGFFAESRGKRQVLRLFGYYIPEALTHELNHNDAKTLLAGKNREMSVLFAGIWDFNEQIRNLKPTELVQFMQAFFTPMTELIYQNHGTLDKYFGATLMAFWGPPVENSAHTYQAVKAALEMANRLVVLEDEFRTRNWPTIKVGLGVHTGTMTIGDMGSKYRMTFTALGDGVDFGRKLQLLTAHYGVRILVSETVKDALPNMIFRELDRIYLPGTRFSVTIYEPLGFREQISPDQLAQVETLHKAITMFRAREWAEAKKVFRNLQERAPETVIYDVYLSRINFFNSHPPAGGWDGSCSAPERNETWHKKAEVLWEH